MTRANSIAVAAGALWLLLQGALPAVSATADTKTPPAAPAAAAAKAPPAPGLPAKGDAKAPPPAVALVPPDYRYSPAGKADPFRPFLEIDQALKAKREESERKRAAAVGRPISPLQQKELAQFRLVGIAGDEQRRSAIVVDGAAKKFYPLFIGTHIGLNGGRVAAILPDRLVVEERVEIREKREKREPVRQIQVLLHHEP